MKAAFSSSLPCPGAPLDLVDKLRRAPDNLVITFLHYGDKVTQ